jgi:spore coat protein U-like protein
MIRAARSALILALLAGPASAQDRGSITSCRVSVDPVAFGSFSGARIDATGRVTITCDGKGSNNLITIGLTNGRANSFVPRQMFGGPNLERLEYNLYTDAAHTTIWGNGQGETRLQFRRFDFQGPATETAVLTIFGSMPDQAPPSPGQYADSISVAVIF